MGQVVGVVIVADPADPSHTLFVHLTAQREEIGRVIGGGGLSRGDSSYCVFIYNTFRNFPF
jgi:hypothetical protein